MTLKNTQSSSKPNALDDDSSLLRFGWRRVTVSQNGEREWEERDLSKYILATETTTCTFFLSSTEQKQYSLFISFLYNARSTVVIIQRCIQDDSQRRGCYFQLYSVFLHTGMLHRNRSPSFGVPLLPPKIRECGIRERPDARAA